MTARKIQIDIVGDATKFTNATKSATTSAGKFGNIMTGIGQGLGIGFTQMAGKAADAVVDFATDSIAAASNLNETLTKSEVIFGDQFAGVKQWAQAAADTLGLSQRAALDAASGFAGLFKTVGIGLKESTGMSQDITKLGTDLASFFNTDMDTALQALKSGLSGESEPLRKFNVFLSETAVSAKLAQMGVKKVGGAFTEAQKATARYALIMEQTGDAQGDFARTSDGLANTQRTLQAQMEDLQAEIGQELLPVMVELATWVSDEGIPAFRELLGVLGVVGAAFGADSKPVDDFRRSAQETGLYWQLTGEQLVGAAEGAYALTGAMKDAARAHQFGGKAIDGAAAAIKGVGTESGRAAALVKSSAEKIVDYWDDLRGKLTGLGSDAADAIYDPIIAAADYAATKREIADTRAIISSKRRVGETIADHEREVTEAKAALVELQKTAFEQQVALLGYGKMNAAEQAAFLAELKRKWATATGEAKADIAALIAYIEKLNANVNIRVTSNAQGNFGARASGGPASGLTWVGERGKELLDLPPGSYVHSNAESMRMASSPTGGGGSAAPAAARGLSVVVNGNIYGPSGVDELMDMIAIRLRLDGV